MILLFYVIDDTSMQTLCYRGHVTLNFGHVYHSLLLDSDKQKFHRKFVIFYCPSDSNFVLDDFFIKVNFEKKS